MATAPKKCGKCDKTVYATEEIRCLDKVWHKGCLKCTSCGTTLNIKTVKGYEKMPYCNAHYPQPKSTAVADNPEMKRLRELQEVQSNVKYHKDFNESKGKVAEAPVKPKDTATATPEPEPIPEPKESPVVPSPVVPEPEPTPESLPSVKPKPAPTNPLASEEPQDVPEASPSTDDAQPKGDSPQASQATYRAVYAYDATADDEITINVGDVLDEVEEGDEGWLKARNVTTGQKGLIPSNYVEINP